MKTIDYIIGCLFLITIAVKLALLPDVITTLKIPIGLYVLGTACIAVLFISICFIRFRIGASKIFISLFIGFGLVETVWRFYIDEIGFGYSLFLCFGYTFVGVILWICDSTRAGSLDDNDSITEAS